MIRSTMQDYPLTISAIMRHGAQVYGASECVTWTGAQPRRTSYAQVAQNAARLAGALARLGIKPGDPVATFCWNNTEHLEAYFGVPSMGAVLHTLNIRLPGGQVGRPGLDDRADRAALQRLPQLERREVGLGVVHPAAHVGVYRHEQVAHPHLAVGEFRPGRLGQGEVALGRPARRPRDENDLTWH